MKISISRVRLQLGSQIIELTTGQAVAIVNGLVNVLREPATVPSIDGTELVAIEFQPYQTPAKIVFIQGEHGPEAAVLFLKI